MAFMYFRNVSFSNFLWTNKTSSLMEKLDILVIWNFAQRNSLWTKTITNVHLNIVLAYKRSMEYLILVFKVL